MIGISKADRLKIISVFNRRIGLLFLFVIALYFDGKSFAALYPNAQTITNCFMLIAFFLLYIRSVKRTRNLMIYAVIIKIDDDVNTKEILEPIFLKEVPTEVYPKIEKILLDLLKHSGYPNVKFESKIDFNELYKNRKN